MTQTYDAIVIGAVVMGASLEVFRGYGHIFRLTHLDVWMNILLNLRQEVYILGYEI